MGTGSAMEAKAAPVTDAAPLTNPHFCTCCPLWAQRPGQGWPARQQVASVTWQDSLHRGQQLLREDLEASGAPRAACDGAGGVGVGACERAHHSSATCSSAAPPGSRHSTRSPVGARDACPRPAAQGQLPASPPCPGPQWAAHQVEVGEDARGLVLLGHEQQRLVVDEVSVLLQRPAQA